MATDFYGDKKQDLHMRLPALKSRAGTLAGDLAGVGTGMRKA